MGFMSALDMRNFLAEERALEWHLQSNHYPPINLVFMDTARKALAAARDEEWDKEIEMPNGLVKTAAQIVEDMHLEAFLV
jgi:hypothetical protein